MLKPKPLALAFLIIGLLLAVVGHSEGSNHYGIFEALALACPGLGIALAGAHKLLAKPA